MTDIRTSLPIPTQPWEAARERLCRDLSPHERDLYSNATLENLFYDASSSQKKHARGSRIWRLQERLSPLVESLEDYGKAMDVYVNTYPLVLSPLWGSLRIILVIVAEATKFQESLVDMLAQIGDILPRFQIYEKLFRNHERLLVALSKVYFDVLQFCVASKDLFMKARKSKISLSIVLRGMWKSHLREFDTYMAKFRSHSKRVEKEAGLAHMIESARIRDIEVQNRALQLRNARYEKRNRVLASLPAVDYLTKQSKHSASKHPGTCQWLHSTPEIEVWYAQLSSGCVCCYGIPGSGKSVLAASIRDFLVENKSSDSSRLVCYYYCDYSDKPSLHMTHLVGSLVKQVLEHLNLELFGEDFTCPYGDGQGLPANSEGSRYLMNLLGKFDRTYLILDGIDELDATNQAQLLSLIDTLVSSPHNVVKIFVTSRTEEFRVKESLKPHPAIYLTTARMCDDIAMFIKGEINDISAPHPLAFDHTLRDEVIQSLVIGAKVHGNCTIHLRLQRLFLWAKFQLADIKEALTKSDLRTILENLPASLNETYLRIIHRTSRSPGGKAKLDTMRKVFCWIAVARRPLYIHELEEAVALESTDTYLHTDRLPKDAGAKLISDCNNLVVLNNNDNTVAFAHHTVEQFLVSAQEGGSKLWELLDLTSVDEEVGEICLAYLSFSDFETQLARIPTQVHVEAPLPGEILWSSVPLGGRVRDMLARGFYWRKSETHKVVPLRFALPVRSTPAETLCRKYSLLEYMIENWVYHSSNLRPHSTAWPRFRHLALYRQLDFEFRPWNDSVHQRQIDLVAETVKATSERLCDKGLNVILTDDHSAQLALYAWAIGHGISSLLKLLDRETLGVYLYLVRAENVPKTVDLDTVWKTRYDDFERLLFSQTTPLGLLEPSKVSYQSRGWTGTLVVQLLQAAFVRSKNESDMRFNYFDLFLNAEITRWAGQDRWIDLVVEAALFAARSGNQVVFDGIWRMCNDDTAPSKLYNSWETSSAFKVIDALLYEYGSHLSCTVLEWDVVFILERYLTEAQLCSTMRHSRASKTKPRVIQTLVVIALASQIPITNTVDFWTQNRHLNKVQSFDPVGSWITSAFGSSDSFLTICPFIWTNVLALIEELSDVLPFLDDKAANTDEDFVRGILSIADIWNKYDRCFSAGMFEKGSIHLLTWAVRNRRTDAANALVPLYRQYAKEQAGRDLVKALHTGAKNTSDEIWGILSPLWDFI